MSGFPWASSRVGTLQVVDWFQGMKLNGKSEGGASLRSVYNPQTLQYEEIPLPQFQQLLRQGKIEESETQSPYDGQPQHIYRLI
jgi:hypothetical protein